jgi:hypothetical protein
MVVRVIYHSPRRLEALPGYVTDCDRLSILMLSDGPLKEILVNVYGITKITR